MKGHGHTLLPEPTFLSQLLSQQGPWPSLPFSGHQFLIPSISSHGWGHDSIGVEGREGCVNA